MSHSPLTIYCVGGAVRDKLLGLPVQDHDWVVSCVEAAGYLAAALLATGIS